MALILHLSDLHLSEPNAVQEVGDFKSEIVDVAGRPNRIDGLKRTLDDLAGALRKASQKLDAIVVSGDITIAGDERGFERLEEVLEVLGDLRPQPSQTVVVPGNHDVTWFPKSSSERYQKFLKHVRARNYITPILDGIDEGWTEHAKHVLIASDKRWTIIPINSAHYCGSAENVAGATEVHWEQWAKAIDGSSTPPNGGAEKALRTLRLRDMPRISPWQFDELAKLIAWVEAQAGSDVLKIAVLHHHLLPVSDVEENKAFESIPNLGLLRQVLRDQRVRIVLHGHKHTAHVYRDHFGGYDTERTAHEVVVVSGGTVGLGAAKDEACRLLEIDVQYPSAAAIRVGGFKSLSPASKLDRQLLDRARWQTQLLWDGAPTVKSDAPIVVRGATTDEAYARIQLTCSLFRSDIHGLICSVDDPNDAHRLPTTYPVVQGVVDRDIWMKELVAWWQRKEETGPRIRFTHGTRIHRYAPDIDQFKRAVDVLRGKRSERAVIAVFDPRKDDISGKRLPAFCMLQFAVLLEKDEYRLAATAFFRNQEMRYWWPINVAEIAMLQTLAIGEIQDIEKKSVVPGRITTVATIANVDKAPQFVAVPEVDLIIDLGREETLWDLTYALVRREKPDENKKRFEELLRNLLPPADIDYRRVAVAVNGLLTLERIMMHFKRNHPHDSTWAKLCTTVVRLRQRNERHDDKLQENAVTRQDHTEWVSEVEQLINEALNELGALR